MGRPKKFNREEVMERAIPVFWKNGFAETSLQDLEKATRVNKSGLYAEFDSKEDLFVSSLRHYYVHSPRREALSVEPLSWDNIEQFLKLVPVHYCGQRGCFAVNSIRELASLPSEAMAIVRENRAYLQSLIENNVRAEKTAMPPACIAEMVMTFFTGLCLEQNLGAPEDATAGKIDEFMRVLRAL